MHIFRDSTKALVSSRRALLACQKAIDASTVCMSDLSLLANSFTSEFTGKFLEISLAISNTFSTLKESDFSKLFAKHPPPPPWIVLWPWRQSRCCRIRGRTVRNAEMWQKVITFYIYQSTPCHCIDVFLKLWYIVS